MNLKLKEVIAKLLDRVQNVPGPTRFQISNTNVSVPASTHTVLGSFKPPKGVYLVFVSAFFSSNSNGARYIYGNTNNGTEPFSWMQRDERLPSSNPCRYQFVLYFDGNTTYYVKARQTSGATLTAIVRANFIKIGEEAVELGGGYCLTAFSRLSAIASLVRGWRYELENEGNAGQSGTSANRSAEAPDPVQTVISGQEKRLGLDSTIHRGFVSLIRVKHEDVYIDRMERRTSSARRYSSSKSERTNAVHHPAEKRRQGRRIWPKQRLFFAKRLDVFRSLRFSELTTPERGCAA